MNPTLPPKYIHCTGRVIAVSAALLILSACSGSEKEREYPVPQSLCGTSIDAGELSKFLPPGKKASMAATNPSSAATRCSVSVDGKKIIYAAQEWWNEMTVLEFAQGLTRNKLDHQTGDGRFIYSNNQAFGKTEDCRNSQHKDQVLYTAVQATGSEHKDAMAMKKLITAYTKAVEQSSACQ